MHALQRSSIGRLCVLLRLRIINIYSEWNRHRNCCADILLTFQRNRALHQLYHLLRDGKSKPRTGKGCPCVRIFLRKRFKGMHEKFPAHAAPRIRTGEFYHRAPIGIRNILRSKRDCSACAVIFHRIAADILQNLFQIKRTANQMTIFMLPHLHLKMDGIFLPLHLNDTRCFCQKLNQIKRLIFRFHFTGFQLVHIQHIINQLHQKAGCLHYLMTALRLLFHVIRIILGNRSHAPNPIQRRADIMAHAA